MTGTSQSISLGLCFLSLTVALGAQGMQLAPPQSSIGAGKNAVPNNADAQSSQITTFKTVVRRVNVDVVVTDSKGCPVTGLTQEDFSIEEDNVLQSVRTFDVHTVTIAHPYIAPQIPPLPPNTFLNVPKSPEPGTPTALLYDALNTTSTEQAYGRQEFLKFLNQRRQDNQIAIFVLSDRLYLLQGFTEALEAPELQKEFQRLADAGLWNRPTSLDRRVAVTLGALTGIGHFLASMPGRKNLIWYSSSFPEALILGGATVNYSEQIRQSADLLNLSHVAIYPVDVRGVRVNPFLSADKSEAFGDLPYSYMSAGRAFAMVDTATRATMDSLADDTGGRAFYGTNDLQEAVDRAMISGSTYYSLTYSPANGNFDGRLRHIKVTLKRSGYNLSYRKTYFADDLNAASRAVADAPESPLTPALERGTPLSYGLFIEAHIEAAGPTILATQEQMRVMSQYGAMQTRERKSPVQTLPVMMQQYLITYGLIARQLEMTADDAGAHQVSLEFGIISYDEDGCKLNGLDTRIDDAIPAPRYAKLASDGYHVVQSVSVPVTAASIRLAVRDVRSNRAGSLEVKLPLRDYY